MDPPLGLDAKLLYKVGGQGGGGSFTELVDVKDVTLNLTVSEADVTTRSSGGWKQILVALKDASVDFEILARSDNVGFVALRNAYLNGAAIGLQIRDRTNGEGLQADFAVTNMTRNEPLGEGLTYSVTVKPRYSATAPSWLEAT